MNNSFYVCKEFYPFLYEKLETAEQALNWAYNRVPGVQPAGSFRGHGGERYWQSRVSGKVYPTNPNEPILFLEEKIIVIKTDRNTYMEKVWWVIIGERTGWLINAEWLKIGPLEI